MITSVIAFIGGVVLGLIAGAGLLFARNRTLERRNAELEQVGQRFDSLAQEAVRKSGEQFLQLAESKMQQAHQSSAHDLDKRQKAIAQMVEPIDKTLKDMAGKVDNLGKAGASLETQLKTFAEDQRHLRAETQNLVQALRNPAARGKWGEMQLQRTLEVIGMVEGTHFHQQQTADDSGVRRQPDFIIEMPGGKRVVIDVKTPVEPYWEALENAESEAEQSRAVERFKMHLRNHLKSLSKKEYWRNFDSPEFVVMFLPTEGLYSMAVSNDPALIEDAAGNNVILASPTTVMGLLRVIMHGWHQQAMAEEARTIADLGAELYRRIATFGGHIQKLGRNLNTAMGAYNEAVGSLEHSVLPAARKMRDHHIQTGGRDIPEMGQIETVSRHIGAEELQSAASSDTAGPKTDPEDMSAQSRKKQA